MQMHRMIQTLLVSLACLLASVTSTAMAFKPVDLIIENGKVPGFTYSLLHTCSTPSCMSGSSLGWMSGTLHGDLVDGKLLNLSGVVDVSGATNAAFQVKGFFDFTPGGVGGELVFDGLGMFSFANAPMSGPANSFDGTHLYAWGGIRSRDGYRMGMDIGGRVVPAVPEPSAALLFGLGSLVVCGRIRR
jgi:hypothetical protein